MWADVKGSLLCMTTSANILYLHSHIKTHRFLEIIQNLTTIKLFFIIEATVFLCLEILEYFPVLKWDNNAIILHKAMLKLNIIN